MKELNYRAANSAEALFRKLPRRTIHRLGRDVDRLARSYGLTYTDEAGKTALITLTLRPRLLPLKMRDSLWRTIRTLDRAFRKISQLYFRQPSLRDLFPFSPRERDWLSILEEPASVRGRIASRWDANTTFGLQEWKEGFSFFEVNGVGVGGLWYGPASADVALKTVIPELRKIDPRFRAVPNHDLRRLLLDTLLAQRKTIGKTKNFIALVMQKAEGSNYIEFERLAGLFRTLGYPSLVAEPTDLRLKGGQILARGKTVDVIYRDTTLSELCALQEKGHDLTAFKEAFRRGQVVSSLEGEFDHKSAFELFSDPRWASAFSSDEQKLFKRHILWTRLLREVKTPDPGERVVDLVPYVLKHQRELVLKPNRLFGGKGVVFGQEVGLSAWANKIEGALKEPGDWVIQKQGKLRKKRFFRPDRNGPREKDLYVVSGFFATEKGLGIVGRMSERAVVNVARRGGLTPILLLK
jgi:hypothetical protein